jgi:predicted HAD superfamily Cof-like phosphohydrolase
MFQAFKDVVQFELANGVQLSDGPPAITDPETVLFCNDLVTEETDEFFDAMADGDLPKIADGIADSIWVLCVTAIRLGIDLPPVWEEVRRTNMAKFGPGSRRREDGKLLKPPGWVAPDIEGVLANQTPLSLEYYSVYAENSLLVPAEASTAIS